MHEHFTMELLLYKVSSVENKKKIKAIEINETEVHSSEPFISRSKEILKRKFNIEPEIRIVSPELICSCGYKTKDFWLRTCPKCASKLKLEMHKGIKLLF